MSDVIITFTTTQCEHKNYTYRKAIVDFYLIELTMIYKVCHKCSEIIKMQKNWKARLK